MPTLVNLSGNQDIDSVLWGYKWDTTALTYGITTSVNDYSNYPAGQIVGYSGEALRAVKRAIVRAVDAGHVVTPG